MDATLTGIAQIGTPGIFLLIFLIFAAVSRRCSRNCVGGAATSPWRDGPLGSVEQGHVVGRKEAKAGQEGAASVKIHVDR